MSVKINGFNVGQDVAVNISDVDSGLAVNVTEFGHMTDFEANSDDARLKIVPITNRGKPIFERIPSGWSGRLTFVRVDGAISDFFATLDADFYAGIVHTFTIMVQVSNRDASVDRYQFTGVKFSRPTFGGFRGDKEVDQTFNFDASEMIKQ